jgi:hypothetical protein
MSVSFVPAAGTGAGALGAWLEAGAEGESLSTLGAGSGGGIGGCFESSAPRLVFTISVKLVFLRVSWIFPQLRRKRRRTTQMRRSQKRQPTEGWELFLEREP